MRPEDGGHFIGELHQALATSDAQHERSVSLNQKRSEDQIGMLRERN
jgi:hypothetical protein